MPIGRKATVQAPTIHAPAIVTQTSFNAPTGDQYNAIRDGNLQFSLNNLTPQTQATIDASQAGLQGLAQDLAQPTDAEVQNIQDQAQNYFDLQAQNINNQSNNLVAQTASDLSHRYGGTYNSTFGAYALGQLQNNRLNALYNAGKDALQMGQNLYNQNQANQIDRFQVLNNYLLDQFNQAQGIYNTGSSLLQDETNRAQNLSIDQAKLQVQAALANQNALVRFFQQRRQAVSTAIKIANAAARSSSSSGSSSATSTQAASAAMNTVA